MIELKLEPFPVQWLSRRKFLPVLQGIRLVVEMADVTGNMEKIQIRMGMAECHD